MKRGVVFLAAISFLSLVGFALNLANKTILLAPQVDHTVALTGSFSAKTLYICIHVADPKALDTPHTPSPNPHYEVG